MGAYTDPLGIQSERAQRDLKTAKALTYTCYQMYAVTKTGSLAGEISDHFVNKNNVGGLKPKSDAKHYLLRPEGTYNC